MTFLVTGSNGFVGSGFCAILSRDGVSVRGAVRSLNSQAGGAETFSIRYVFIKRLGGGTEKLKLVSYLAAFRIDDNIVRYVAQRSVQIMLRNRSDVVRSTAGISNMEVKFIANSESRG